MKSKLTTRSIMTTGVAVIVFSVMLFGWSASSQTIQTDQPMSLQTVIGELIVQLSAEKDTRAVADEFAAYNLRAKKLLSRRMNIWLFEYDGNGMKAAEQASLLSEIRSHSKVELAQFNHLVTRRQSYPNDPSFGVQWALHNTGQSGGTVDADIDAPEAWDVVTGGVTADGDEIVVAVIDGGCDLNHADLNLFKNVHEIPGNGIDDDTNGYVDDYDGWNAYGSNGNVPSDYHGTHVAGIAAAVGNNGIGVSGVNWGAKVLPIAGSSSNEAIVVEAYGYVVEMRARYDETDGAQGAFIVSTNSSFGIDFGDPADSPVWCAMYDSMGILGILSAAATANRNVDIDVVLDVPTACLSDFLLAVTNTTRNDVRNSGAAYGKKTIDLGAPGTSVYSTTPGGYGSLTGTSMATPHVAGAVAFLYAAASPDLIQQYKNDPATVALLMKQYIMDGTDSLSSLAGITVSEGRLNINNSLQLMESLPPQLTATFPIRNGLNISPDADISITFDAAMNEATINDSTLVVNAASSGRVAGTVSYDSPTRTAFFDPVDSFGAGELVTVALTEGVESSQGLALEGGYLWTFTVVVTEGTGEFAGRQVQPVGDAPLAVTATDLDGDGDIDLGAANGGSDDVSTVLNNGDRTFAAHSVHSVSGRPNSVVGADLDGDGDVDLVTAHDTSDYVSVLLNQGGALFDPFSTYAVGAGPRSVVAADFDGDGDFDLATANSGVGSVSVLVNNGNGSFGAPSDFAVGTGPLALVAGDFDGDGDFDLAVADELTNDIAVLSNNGDGTFPAPTDYPVEGGAVSITAGDFNGDGELDLATAHSDSAAVSVLLNVGDGTFSAFAAYPVGAPAVSIVAGDLDGDGDIDLATANETSNGISVLLNGGTGSFGAASFYPAGDQPSSITAADFDGDGGLELATANAGANNVSILVNTCCMGGIRGNVDYDPADVIDITDLIYMVEYMFESGLEPTCWAEANVDGGDVDSDGMDTGFDIDIADLVYVVDYMFNGGPPPVNCP